jgi:DNA-binding CsgD family transcriptional regulator/tetratricopeptide (TPR) repeat protein
MAGELLERDAERAALASAVERVATANGGELVLVLGEAGIGKTALLAVVDELAQAAGLRTFRAAGAPLERDFGYGVVRQLLEAHLRSRSSKERAKLLCSATAPAAPVFGLPDLQAPVPAEGDRSSAVRHALVLLVEELTRERPVALVVDDLHWADGASLRWLAHLARRLDRLPALIVSAARTGEPGEEDAVLAELVAAPGTQVLRPGSLSADAVAALASTTLNQVSVEFASACHELTAGNPLLIDELLRAAREEGLAGTAEETSRLQSLGAGRVAGWVMRRLGRVSADGRELASAVAVLGSARVAEAAALAGLALRDAEAAADELIEARMLRRELPLVFAHPLLRAAVEAELPPARRARAHRRAAELLAADPARADEVAVHLLRTDPAGSPWVVEALCAAGNRALARGAPNAAVALLGRALEEPAAQRRGAVLVALGRAERHAGRTENAARHLREAIGLAPAAERDELAGELALALFYHNRHEEAAAALEAAIAGLEGSGEEVRERRLRLEADFAIVSFAHERLIDRGIERLDRAAGELRGDTAAERALLALRAYQCCWSVSTSASEVVCELEPLLRKGDLLDDLTPDSALYSWVALAFWYAERVPRALELLDAGERRARRRGAVPLLAMVLNARSRILASLGELEEAYEVAHEVTELGLEGPLQYGVPTVAGVLVMPLVELGRLEEARQALERHAPRQGYVGPIGSLHAARMALHRAEGRTQQAVADAEELLERLRGRRHGGLRLKDAAAETLLVAGQHERAAAVAAEGLEAAERWGAPGTIAPFRRVLGLAQRDEQHLRAAVTLSESGPFHPEAARCLLALGAHLRRSGRRAEAREPLRRALDLAGPIGARPLQSQAQTELRACGARPRSLSYTGVGSLTPSERRVAELVAAGRSNPEVAHALFVSRATVETHLRSVFRKLGVTSRAELAPLLSGHARAPGPAGPEKIIEG